MDFFLAFCLAAVGCAVLALYTFIRRLERGEIQLHVHPAQAADVVYPKENASVVPSRNPWNLSVAENALSVKISSLTPFSVQAYWGIDAPSLETVISEGNGREQEFLHRRHNLQRFLSISCGRHDILMPNAPSGDHDLLPGDGLAERSSENVLLLVMAASPDDAQSEYDAAALVSLLTLQPAPKGSTSPLLFHLDRQWVMNYHAATCKLKALYESGAELLSDDRDAGSRSAANASPSSETGALGGGGDSAHTACVVCHVNRATEALLPCRHVALCVDCLERVAVCPVCRSAIQSRFTVT